MTSDARLLTTVAGSIGVALENARLFEETQRLLRETEQRTTELAAINSIQQGIAAQVDFAGIIDLVGDSLRESLGVENIGICVVRRVIGAPARHVRVRARRTTRRASATHLFPAETSNACVRRACRSC